MTERYALHYAPDNASLVIRLALEGMGLPYRKELVDRAHNAQDSAACRALNPNGLIRVLGTPQCPIFGTAAITAEGLGTAPFTAPTYAKPPEGSAT